LQGHFDRNLNLRALILEKRPKLIVECGAGAGECTRLIAHMKWYYPFDFYSITDKAIENIEGVEWKIGLSYERLKEFQDSSIDLCIIDTDHNYWTLQQELLAVAPKMKEGGLVVFHDVEEFYYDTGMGMSYWNDAPYPEEKIMATAKLGGVGLCLIDFLSACRGLFKLVRWIPEHFGCAVIEKRTITETRILRPGPASVFARAPKVEAVLA
jgi:hypothetical protein